MLVLSGKIHNLSYLGLGDLIRIDPADPDTALMHIQRNSGCLLPGLVKEAFENVNNERHRSVVSFKINTLYIEGFFVFGFALTTTPVPGLSSPRFPLSLISVRADNAARSLTNSCPDQIG
jgi:hypothetical protein